MPAQIVEFEKPRRVKPRGPRRYKALNDAFIRRAKPGRYADGDGLYLVVLPSGVRKWIQRLMLNCRGMELGLGTYSRGTGAAVIVGLKAARAQALDNCRLVQQGINPVADKRRRRALPTFQDAARMVWENAKRGWTDEGHARDWWSRMERHVFPRLMNTHVTEITKTDIKDVLAPIWTTTPATARTVKAQVVMVMKWAVASELRTDNPCDEVDTLLGAQGSKAKVEHMRAVHHSAVSSAIDKVRASGKWRGLVLAFEFLVLTAARSGEVRGATWAEFNGDVWTVPAGRMKAKREHRVPLAPRALAVLAEARKGEGLVFPSKTGKVLHDSMMSRLMAQCGIDAVPHGFRSSFRDWATEHTSHPDNVVEASLAHADTNRTRAAYARSDVLDKRRQLMAEWAAYLGTDA